MAVPLEVAAGRRSASEVDSGSVRDFEFRPQALLPLTTRRGMCEDADLSYYRLHNVSRIPDIERSATLGETGLR